MLPNLLGTNLNSICSGQQDYIALVSAKWALEQPSEPHGNSQLRIIALNERKLITFFRNISKFYTFSSEVIKRIEVFLVTWKLILDQWDSVNVATLTHLLVQWFQPDLLIADLEISPETAFSRTTYQAGSTFPVFSFNYEATFNVNEQNFLINSSGSTN